MRNLQISASSYGFNEEIGHIFCILRASIQINQDLDAGRWCGVIHRLPANSKKSAPNVPVRA